MAKVWAKPSAKGTGRKHVKDDVGMEPGGVKIQSDTAGAAPSAPDYAMLRAALASAQASTPTAIAGRALPAAPRPAEVLAQIFGDGRSDPQQLGVLHGSFNPAAAAGSHVEKEK